MANTWRSTYQAIAYAATKHMIDVFNASGSARYIRVYRVYAFNGHTTAVTGVVSAMQIRRIGTSVSSGTTITPIAHNTANSSLNANTTSGTGRTTTLGSLFRQFLWQNEEVIVTTLNFQALQCLVPYAEVWNAGYGDTNVEPIMCRSGQNEGVSLYNVTSTTVGSVDAEIEFTDAAS